MWHCHGQKFSDSAYHSLLEADVTSIMACCEVDVTPRLVGRLT